MSDRVAVLFVRLLRYEFIGTGHRSDILTRTTLDRWGFDLVSGYKHKPIPPNSNMSLEELRKGGYVMTEHDWLNVSVDLMFYSVSTLVNV